MSKGKLVPYHDAYNDPEANAKRRDGRFQVFNVGIDDNGPWQVVEYNSHELPDEYERLIMGLALHRLWLERHKGKGKGKS